MGSEKFVRKGEHKARMRVCVCVCVRMRMYKRKHELFSLFKMKILIER